MNESLQIFLEISGIIQFAFWLIWTILCMTIILNEAGKPNSVPGSDYPSRKQYLIVSTCILFYPIVPILFIIVWDKPFKKS